MYQTVQVWLTVTSLKGTLDGLPAGKGPRLQWIDNTTVPVRFRAAGVAIEPLQPNANSRGEGLEDEPQALD